MTILTQYVCDRCIASQETAEQMWDIAILCEAINQYRTGYYTPTKQQKAMWCRKCVDEMKIFVGLRRSEEGEPQAPTIEDIIREIVQQTIIDERERG